MRLLVVEDQKELNEVIVKKLENEGYAVDGCYDGMEAINYIESAEYDGIILDIMLPKIDGIGVTKKIRMDGIHTPVLLLTALGSVDDRVKGLDAGADDYLTKPFDFNELLARIRAMLRRREEKTSTVLEHKGVTVNISSHEVSRDGKEIELTSKEYNILEYMMQNIGCVISRDKLSTHVWNYDYDGGSNVIDVYMHHLRKKIDEDYDDKLISTVKGVGYIIK